MSLQQRQKWVKPRRNLHVSDIVIIKGDEGLPRNQRQLARVAETHESADGYVRTVKVALADRCLDSKGKRTNPVKFSERPMQKLVLLQRPEVHPHRGAITISSF